MLRPIPSAAVSLSLPPNPGLLHVVRTVTTSTASLIDMPVEVIDDLCIAVNEAAGVLLSAGGAAHRLTVQFELEERAVTVAVSGDGESVPWPPPRFEAGLAALVLSRLTDTHRLELTLSGPQILLQKTTPALHNEEREQLFRDHLPLVDKIARRYGGRGVPVDDLKQVASLGLLKATGRFEAERGVPFPAYARQTMDGEIKRHFRDYGWTVKVPRTVQELSGEIGRVIDELTQRLGRTPTVNETAADTGLLPETVVEVLAASTAYQPDKLGGGTDDGIGNDAREFVEPAYESVEALASFEPALARLSPRERQVVVLRVAFDLSQRQIAARVGISQMHVSRLLNRSMTQLRQWAVESQASTGSRQGG